MDQAELVLLPVVFPPKRLPKFLPVTLSLYLTPLVCPVPKDRVALPILTAVSRAVGSCISLTHFSPKFLVATSRHPSVGLTILPFASRFTERGALLSLQLPFAPPCAVIRRSILSTMPLLGDLESDLAATMSTLWADSTWDTRMRCWHQLMEFIEALQVTSDVEFSQDDLMKLSLLFLQYRLNTGSTHSTVLATASSISASLLRVCPHLPRTSLQDFMKIMRRSLTTPLQALPLSPQEMAAWVISLPRRERLAAIIAWSTSARWDDMIGLLRSDITASPEGWLIHFRATKASIEADFRPDTYIPLLNLPQFMFAALNALQHSEPVTRLSTEEARRSLAVIQPSMETLAAFTSCRRHFTAHSVKRGAQTSLWRLAAQGPAISRFGPLQIAMMGRHKTPNWPIPSTSVRYAADRLAMGKALGLHHASSHLFQQLYTELIPRHVQ